jgi:RNA polymerase sigma-70 factor, ECF subfamily
VVTTDTAHSGVGVHDACENRADGGENISPRTAANERMRELYKAHGQALYRFLLGVTFGQQHVIEDLVQETLLRAWRHLDQLAPNVNALRPWLFTVARRIAIDAARARQVRPQEVGAVDLTIMPDRDDAIERLVTVQTVRTALGALKPEHRQVLVEVYYRGRSVAEVAALLGIPEGTVKSRTFNALRALRVVLDWNAAGDHHAGSLDSSTHNKCFAKQDDPGACRGRQQVCQRRPRFPNRGPTGCDRTAKPATEAVSITKAGTGSRGGPGRNLTSL